MRYTLKGQEGHGPPAFSLRESPAAREAEAQQVPGELERPRLSRRLWAVHATESRRTPLVDELVDLLRDVCADLREEWRDSALASTD